MIVYPALDLMGGRAVRLQQGRFDRAKTYASDPEQALSGFAEAGASWAHIVDLDGAREGGPIQHDLIASLVLRTRLSLQIGGGFRTRDQVALMLDSGAARVVIGSLAVTEPDRVRALLDEFGPERITLALDVRLVDGVPKLVRSGWSETSSVSLWTCKSLYPQATHLLLTDVGKDGMLMGPNFALLKEAARRLSGWQIQASGGVSGLSDLSRLSVDGVVIGKALWEGRFTLQEALNAVA